MNGRRFAIIAGIGCGILVLLVIIAIPVSLLYFLPINRSFSGGAVSTLVVSTAVQVPENPQETVPTFTPAAPSAIPIGTPSVQGKSTAISSELLESLYKQSNPAVVSLTVEIQQAGQVGAVSGSGFIINDQGHIVTNNHVVSGAQLVIVSFYDGTQSRARIVGTDIDSDLAVVQVDELPENTHPIQLGDSDGVLPGDWVIAIGNPFTLSSTMTVGVVSAVGRTIPTGVTAFSIPEAIQTDAAINPGNSGGPLIDLQGEVIGVNAQIATGSGSRANAGVGFAIPVNIVRRVVPALIKSGSYQWPWLGVEGRGVDLFIMEANRLESQKGAYIGVVDQGGPAEQADLRGTTGTTVIDGINVPVGGDVVIGIDGKSIGDFNDLVAEIASKNPGDQIDLTIIRSGQQRNVTVQLASRPANFQPQQNPN
ncbi:MAG: trypsin-like peptidase domain-containing protein [Anaerolineales bacterium]|jgi:S1-C subfamily serine protease